MQPIGWCGLANFRPEGPTEQVLAQSSIFFATRHAAHNRQVKGRLRRRPLWVDSAPTGAASRRTAIRPTEASKTPVRYVCFHVDTRRSAADEERPHVSSLALLWT